LKKDEINVTKQIFEEDELIMRIIKKFLEEIK